MKKTLLTLAAVAISVGAWAQDNAGLIDVTPNYYNFNKINSTQLTSILRSDVRQPVPFNLGGDNWITSNTNGGENYFTSEQIANGNILFGAFVYNQSKEAEFAKAFSLLDLGGNLGQVLVLNGQNSNLNEAVQEACGLDAAPEIPAYQGAFGANFQYNHILDFESMNKYVLEANPGLTAADLLEQAEDAKITPIRIRIRVEMNAYNNDMSKELSIVNTTFLQNEAGNAIGFDVMDPDNFTYVDVSQFSENGVWNPNLWLVREWDVDYTGIASYIKFLGTNTDSDFDNGALLVRSLKVFVLPEGEESYPNYTKVIDGVTKEYKFSTFHDTLVDYSEVAVEPAYPENLYMMGNIVNNSWNPSAAVAPESAEDGVFTFTDIELYNTATDPAFFTFINTLSDNWDLINDGSHRYGPAEGQNGAVNVGQSDIKFALGGDTSFNIANGTYDFVVDFNTMTIAISEAGSVGVKTVIDFNAPVEYYNLNGVKVANPDKGIYIIRQGNTTKKAVIR
ncbi:MAG: hypothetical protein J1F67_02920 [Muribaculaceae bacterium]|nr:hypothetical protein [Muribaculaceae bacterium]